MIFLSTQVVRIEGYNKGSLGTIGRECDRAEGINHRNQEIEQDLSFLNHSYKDASHGFVSEFSDIKTALNAQGKETKKGVAFEGMIITADLPFFEGLGYERGKPMPKEVKAFFDRSYEFAKAQIGYQGTDKNILSAKIHLDEKTPHLHLYYMPITEKWQSKVYAKAENGKVLRTEKGTPIQAKDENGKILYEQHEDLTAPKLSRTEFWRVRGGQSSYRQMQDRFYQSVGKEYKLERGEVGSDRKHKKTAVYKQEQLTAEKNRLVAEITPYRELKQGIEEVEIQGKTILPGVVAIKKKNLETVKEQAKSYTVNRDELNTIRQRTQSVKARESRANQREQLLDNRAVELAHQQSQVQEAYQRQLNLNQILEETKKQRDYYKCKCAFFERENISLKVEIEKVKETLTNQIKTLKSTVREAYKNLRNVVKAVGMLKHDKKNGYGVPNLTKKQEKLIDGITKYSVKCAKEDGQHDFAENMEKYIGISKSIQNMIEPSKIELSKTEPSKQHNHSHDYRPSL